MSMHRMHLELELFTRLAQVTDFTVIHNEVYVEFCVLAQQESL
jgi:hypothetical protein